MKLYITDVQYLEELPGLRRESSSGLSYIIVEDFNQLRDVMAVFRKAGYTLGITKDDLSFEVISPIDCSAPNAEEQRIAATDIIEAIRRHRTRTRMGLADSKAAFHKCDGPFTFVNGNPFLSKKGH